MKSSWTERRFARLIARYDRRYWAGNLPSIHIRISNLDGFHGRIEWPKREILIDIDSHSAIAQFGTRFYTSSATWLHLARRVMVPDFGPRLKSFFVRVTVGCPEAPGLKILSDVVPRKFPLAHRLMQKAEQSRGREVEKICQGERP